MRSWTPLLFLVVAACGSEDVTLDRDAGGDAADTSDGGTLPDVSNDVDDDSGDVGGDDPRTDPDSTGADTFSPPDATDAGAPDADATDAGAPDADVMEEDVPGPDGSDVDDAGSDADALAACLEACGVGCPAPEYQPCGADGQLYCSHCVMDCHGVEEEGDPTVCGIEPCPAPEGESVPFTLWTPPEECRMDPWTWVASQLVTSEAAFAELGLCGGESVDTGIDWSTRHLLVAVYHENPEGRLDVLVEDDTGRGIASVTAPAYCGGARPPTTTIFALVPTGLLSVDVRTCQRTRCPHTEFPVP